ncbi:MAG: hypothetical protein KGM15_11380 [Pseudomonadota bacterium]|nr:hypothetical protein [Pseudomonadota bacterium]
MSDNYMIAALVYMMVQAVMFGVGLIVVLSTPISLYAMSAIPLMIAATAATSAPVSLTIAPRLTARYWRGRSGDFISG